MKAAMLTSFSPEEVKIVSDAYALALKTFETAPLSKIVPFRFIGIVNEFPTAAI